MGSQTNEGITELFSEYLRCFEHFLDMSFVHSAHRFAQVLRAARDKGASVFIAGNGGSAAIASHWVNDLGKATKVSGNPPMKVLSLSDNISWLTALANDEGYERVFSGQLENFAKPEDVLIVISSSGNSQNLIEAVELARSRSVTTLALLGFDGGRLKEIVDHYLLLPTKKGEYGIVESAHGVICHVLTTTLTQRVATSSESEDTLGVLAR